MFSRTPYTIFSWLTPWHLFQIWCGARFLMESLFWQPYIISVIWLHLGISGIFFFRAPWVIKKKDKSLYTSQGAHQAALISSLSSITPPLDGILSHWSITSSIKVATTHLYFWVEGTSEALQEFSVLPRNATPCRQPGPKPRLFNQIRVSNDMCAVIGQCASQN